MNMSEKIDQLALGLSQYQGTAINPNNSAKNPFLKNSYAPLNEILAHVRPDLAKHGLSVTQLVGGEDKISVTTMLLHASGQWIADTVSLTPDSSKGLSTAQNAGVVITYLRRYGLTAILGIAGEDDTDGHEEAKKKTEPESVDKKPPACDPLAKYREETRGVLTALKTDLTKSQAVSAGKKFTDAKCPEDFKQLVQWAQEMAQLNAAPKIPAGVERAAKAFDGEIVEQLGIF